MNLQALKSTTSKAVAALATAASAVILGSCGGGGAGSSNIGSILTLLPSVGTFYAGVPYEFTVAGGVVPYLVSSSEPDAFPVPSQVSGHTFTVIPNNPGVIDAGLPADALAGRTVIVQLRDKNGALFSSPSTRGIFVARNFFTGYGIFFQGGCAPPLGGGTPPQACPGGDTIVTAVAVTNGVLFGNRQFRFDVIRGPYGFIDCDPSSQPANPAAIPVNTMTCPTDHEGKANVRMRVQIGVPTQLATIRLTDVATGVTATHVFTISGSVAGALTAIPDSLTFTGPTTLRCGTGPGGFQVFDAQLPLTVTSSSSNFIATAIGSQVIVSGTGNCDEGVILVVDAQGRRITVDVEAVAGTLAPPALTVSPATANLNATCGFVTSVAVIGGAGTLSAISSHARVSASISGNTISISRAASGDGATVFPTTATISITDGSAIVNIAVSGVAANCP